MSEQISVSCKVSIEIHGQSFEMSRDDAIRLITQISLAIGFPQSLGEPIILPSEMTRPLPDMREWWKHGVWSGSSTKTDIGAISDSVKASADALSLNKIRRDNEM